jgi:drug/metabolite transporter (DMT)-like permease
MSEKGIAFAIMAAIVSGISVFFNGVAVGLSDPIAYTLLKNAGAFALIGALVLALGETRHFRNLSRKQWGMLALIGVIGGSVPFMMFFWGLKLGGAAASSFIFRSLFVFAGVFGYFLLRERPEPRDVAAGFLILVGNALLISGDMAFGTGQLLVLGATVLWALEYTVSRKALSGIHPRALMASRMFFGSLLLLSFMGATGSLGALGAISIEVLSWLAVTSLMLGLFLMAWYNALRHLPVMKASCILALGGIVTACLNAAFMGKAVAPAEGLGFLMILVGGAAAAQALQLAGQMLRAPSYAGA